MNPLRPALAAVVLAVLASSCSKPTEASSQPAAGSVAPRAEGRVIEITAGNEGYKPATVEAKQGESLVLRFTRTTKSDCLAQVVFPEQKISRDLPMNTPVEIAIKADKAGKIPFQCGMAMIHGSVNVTGS